MNRRTSIAFTQSALGRRITLWLMAVLLISSAAFLMLFVTLYRERLIIEHARASTQVNKLLEASLKNAMLNRDLPGLQKIVNELGAASDIADVFIVNPKGEVRFSSKPAMQGRPFTAGTETKPDDMLSASWQFKQNDAGEEVLRTINPVHNESRCQQCHGPVAEHPINGILIVDYAAGHIRADAWRSAGLMAGAGGAVLFAALGAITAIVNRRVLQPIGAIDSAAQRFAEGELATRANIVTPDEFGRLSSRFNAMAETIQDKVERLESGEAFLQQVIDAVPDGVRVIGTDYKVLKVNSAYCAQLGITAEEALGRPCYASSHRLDAPCSARLVTCPLEELSLGKRTELKCVHRHLRKDGTELFVEVSAAVAPLSNGGDHCIVESIRDLSNQAEASHQQRLSEIGQLAAGIAHEIHNPLWSIHLALSALRNDLPHETREGGAQAYLDIAAAEINRCLDVSRRLLQVSEPSSAETTLIDVELVLKDVVNLVSYQAMQSRVESETVTVGKPRVIANESDFGIIALNLIQNAIHAMPEGGKLTVKSEVSADKVIISVTDTGVGIAADDLHRIFWPFWSKRADASSGSGLGLAICKATVQRMGGIVSVESRQGFGSTFTVTLPNPDWEGQA